MRDGIIYSTGLHLVIVALAVFGLPIFESKPRPIENAIIVEIVTIGKETTARNAPKPQPKKRPRPKERPEEVKRKPTPKAPDPPQAAALPDPVAEPVPPPKPEPKVKPKPKPKAKPKTVSKPKVKAKPRAKPKRRREQDDFLAALRSVEEIERNAPPTEAPPEENKDKHVAKIDDRLTISELDALKQQLYRCWNVPIGAREPEKLAVEVRVYVRPDRTVQRAEILNRPRMAQDAYFRAMAESAFRAVMNPKCSPLLLPPTKYETWKTLVLNFDPKEMVR